MVIRPGEGKVIGMAEFLATSEMTPRFTLSILTVEPGEPGPGLHTHEDEDDAFYVISGELTFNVDGERITAPPGTFVLAPPGVVHNFSNRSDEPARALNLHAPAGFDKRMEARR